MLKVEPIGLKRIDWNEVFDYLEGYIFWVAPLSNRIKAGDIEGRQPIWKPLRGTIPEFIANGLS